MAEPEWVMVTTVDTDVHLFKSNIDLMRLKVERNTWLATVDGRFVKSDKVVSVWTPTEEELRGFTEALNG